MTAREFDPLRLDVAAFAKEAGQLDGRWPLHSLERAASSTVADDGVVEEADVRWSARGERRSVGGGQAQIWLHLQANAQVLQECQRCLNPVCVALSIERSFLFVHGEDAAARLDADSEDDVLALTRSLDLRELVEDELLLAMPLVPRHELCPEPLKISVNADEPPSDLVEPNPFTVLETLKRSRLN